MSQAGEGVSLGNLKAYVLGIAHHAKESLQVSLSDSLMIVEVSQIEQDVGDGVLEGPGADEAEIPIQLNGIGQPPAEGCQLI